MSLGTQAQVDRQQRTVLAEALLRPQRPRLRQLCREAAIYTSQSGEKRPVRQAERLGVEQLSSLRNRSRRDCTDRVGMDGEETWMRRYPADSAPTAPIKWL